jgi:predicted amidohydrolase YtcJ
MALHGYRTRPARAVGEQGGAGQVAMGHRADLTVVEVDPLAAPPDELAQATVPFTVVGGQLVHH